MTDEIKPIVNYSMGDAGDFEDYKKHCAKMEKSQLEVIAELRAALVAKEAECEMWRKVAESEAHTIIELRMEYERSHGGCVSDICVAHGYVSTEERQTELDTLRVENERLRRLVGNRADYSDEEFEKAWQHYLGIRKRIRISDDNEEKGQLIADAMQHAEKYGIHMYKLRAETAESRVEELEKKIDDIQQVIASGGALAMLGHPWGVCCDCEEEE